MRWAAHNGEINTVRGNQNWMRSREGVLKSGNFGDELELLYPIVEEGGSDSAAFDNVLELLVVNGVLTLPEAVMMLVPEAWQSNDLMEPEKKVRFPIRPSQISLASDHRTPCSFFFSQAFYRWAANLMEPWDGPALFTFADGRYCGASLDRNGLRPCRWVLTSDDIIVAASEVGAIALDNATIIAKGRLKPGRMLLVDTKEGRIVDDKELKMTAARKRNFQSWLDNQQILVPDIIRKVGRSADLRVKVDNTPLASDPLLLAFGYTVEQLSLLMLPMISDGKEVRDSTSTLLPECWGDLFLSLAVHRRSDRWVTMLLSRAWPPLPEFSMTTSDSSLLRCESLVGLNSSHWMVLTVAFSFPAPTLPSIPSESRWSCRSRGTSSYPSCCSLRLLTSCPICSYVGPEGNLLDVGPEQCHRIVLPSPVITTEEMVAFKNIHLAVRGWKTKTIDITFPKEEGLPGYKVALDRVRAEASAAVDEGYTIIVLSDRATGPDRVPISALIACGGAHHELVREKKRAKVALMVETGEAREVHHMCCLVSFGADAVSPYLMEQIIHKIGREGLVKDEISVEEMLDNFKYATDNGILKVMSKVRSFGPRLSFSS